MDSKDSLKDSELASTCEAITAEVRQPRRRGHNFVRVYAFIRFHLSRRNSSIFVISGVPTS